MSDLTGDTGTLFAYIEPVTKDGSLDGQPSFKIRLNKSGPGTEDEERRKLMIDYAMELQDTKLTSYATQPKDMADATDQWKQELRASEMEIRTTERSEDGKSTRVVSAASHKYAGCRLMIVDSDAFNALPSTADPSRTSEPWSFIKDPVEFGLEICGGDDGEATEQSAPEDNVDEDNEDTEDDEDDDMLKKPTSPVTMF